VGVCTTRLAVAALPAPPSFELTALVVLFCVPAVVPVTFTEKVQEELAASVAPDRLTEPDPAVAVMAPPPQEPARPLGEDTTSPAGRVSVKPTPVSDPPALGSVMVKPRLAVPPTGMLAAPNAMLMVGGKGNEAHRLAGKTRAIHKTGDRRTEKKSLIGDSFKSKLDGILQALTGILHFGVL
jgi:hypothetical protein